MNLQGYDYRRDDEFMMWGIRRKISCGEYPRCEDDMAIPNPLEPVKGSGTTLWVYTGTGDAYANPLSDDEWTRLAKIKDLITAR
ncbi:phage tail tube protein [Escherichia coli]